MLFARLDRRDVVADFGGGAISSDAGALLLGATDKAIRLVERFADCFSDGRSKDHIVHDVATMVGQRVFGIALGYEDLIDHDDLRHDPVLGTVLGRLEARRRGCAPLAGKSTLNRLEHAPASKPGRYHRIDHDPAAIENLFVDLFLDAHEKPPARIVLDLDATDDPIHGHQEGRFFHGYGACPPAAERPTGGTVTAICRSTCSAAITCWQPGYGARTSTPAPARSRRQPVSSSASAPAEDRFDPIGRQQGDPENAPIEESYIISASAALRSSALAPGTHYHRFPPNGANAAELFDEAVQPLCPESGPEGIGVRPCASRATGQDRTMLGTVASAALLISTTSSARVIAGVEVQKAIIAPPANAGFGWFSPSSRPPTRTAAIAGSFRDW